MVTHRHQPPRGHYLDRYSFTTHQQAAILFDSPSSYTVTANHNVWVKISFHPHRAFTGKGPCPNHKANSAARVPRVRLQRPELLTVKTATANFTAGGWQSFPFITPLGQSLQGKVRIVTREMLLKPRSARSVSCSSAVKSVETTDPFKWFNVEI